MPNTSGRRQSDALDKELACAVRQGTDRDSIPPFIQSMTAKGSELPFVVNRRPEARFDSHLDLLQVCI